MAKTARKPAALTETERAAIVTRIGACVIADTTNRETMLADIKLLFATDGAYNDKAAYADMHGSIKAYRVMGKLRLASIDKARETIKATNSKDDTPVAKIIRAAAVYASELLTEARYGGKKAQAKRKAKVSGANTDKAKGEGDMPDAKAFLVAGIWKTTADCRAYCLRVRDNARGALTKNQGPNAANAYADALRQYMATIEKLNAEDNE